MHPQTVRRRASWRSRNSPTCLTVMSPPSRLPSATLNLFLHLFSPPCNRFLRRDPGGCERAVLPRAEALLDPVELLAERFHPGQKLRGLGLRRCDAADVEDAARLQLAVVDLLQAVEALAVRHRQQLRLGQQLFGEGAAAHVAAVDQHGGRAFRTWSRAL